LKQEKMVKAECSTISQWID